MPIRPTPLVTGEYYHIYNRGVNRAPIFHTAFDYRRALEALRFYRFSDLPCRYSVFRLLSRERRQELWNTLEESGRRSLDLVAFVLLPNHYHLLVCQKTEQGIVKTVGCWENSLARYLNQRHGRVGPLFQGTFKAVRVEDDEQLLHVSRYIHINPYASHVVGTVEELMAYPWSSLPEYLRGADTRLCDPSVVLSQFSDRQAYRSFLLDRIDYQRTLGAIGHLLHGEGDSRGVKV